MNVSNRIQSSVRSPAWFDVIFLFLCSWVFTLVHTLCSQREASLRAPDPISLLPFAPGCDSRPSEAEQPRCSSWRWQCLTYPFPEGSIHILASSYADRHTCPPLSRCVRLQLLSRAPPWLRPQHQKQRENREWVRGGLRPNSSPRIRNLRGIWSINDLGP